MSLKDEQLVMICFANDGKGIAEEVGYLFVNQNVFAVITLGAKLKWLLAE